MTGPAQPAPGWYPDPDGSPGMVRWWNGISWSDVATPAGPGVAVQSSPVLAPPVRPTTAPIDFPVTAPSGGGNSTAWIVGISLLVIVAVIGAVMFASSPGDGTATADPTVPTAVPQSPAGPTFAPGTVRIIDEVSGISYPFLGDGWFEWALWDQQETTETAGQYFTTQELTPDGQTFISQCTSGPLADMYGWTGPSSLQSTLATVADSVRFNYYPRPNERTVLRDEDRMVDGHAARLYEFQLSWDVEGYDATGERAALLLIDVGKPAPALLYMSIPNTHAELYGAINRVLDSVEVL